MLKNAPLPQPEMFFGFCTFDILGFQVSVLLNNLSELPNHWFRHYKKKQRLVETAVVKM